MKILFHVGVGNNDRPSRWSFVNKLFSDLARSFEALGHECLLWNHDKATNPNIYKKHITSANVKPISFKPDWVFTWNGVSEGDQLIEKMFGKNKMIYGELGFFDHYSTLYFDFGGTNGRADLLNDNLPQFNQVVYDNLVKKYKLPRLFNEPFVFVPLQDETDTQITKFSNIKKMDNLLGHVANMYKGTNMKILYKQHPKAPCIVNNRPNFIEVKDNVHHYLPYAEKVIGINSTVLLEALIYHDRVITLGNGITSRQFEADEHKKYVTYLISRQFKWADMGNPNIVKNSYFYKKMTS